MAMKSKKYKSILGLAFEGKDLEVCQVHRSGERPRIVRRHRAPLLLDPLSGEPELVGREIRNQLDAAGIRETKCAVCLPLKWLLATQIELPELAGSDLDDYLALQAERAFPYAPEDLMLAASRVSLGDGAGLATLVAFSRNSATHLQAVLKATRLRPVLFTFALATLPPPPDAVALLAHGAELDLAVFAAGGITALRPLNDARQSEAGDGPWDFDLIAKQIRITLGCLPAAVQDAIDTLHVFGPQEQISELTAGLPAGMTPLGLAVQPGRAELPMQGNDTPRWSAAAAVAVRYLTGPAPVFDFLPPQISRFKQLASRLSARGLLYLGIGGATLALLLSVAFVTQGMRLQRLELQWKMLKPKVDRVKALQDSVRTFRPWFDNSVPSLTITARIAQAFPEEGSVWVKTLEVKDLSTITCTGNARSDRDWLLLLDSLRKTPGITDLQVLQARGNNPLQFSLSFHWKKGAGDAL